MGYELDGHELGIVSTFVGVYVVANRTLPKGWGKHLLHRHPIGALALACGVTGIALPLVVPRIRRSLGFPTDQYDHEHPNVKFDKWIEETRS
mmetsp:Transcript_20979/g.49596  ORF Transcript_20979/g.49596 Transcript_20979/m.49596 type:complete len:92 (+) Transcript_20979:40-315(+)